MYYYSTNEKKRKVAGALAALGYMVLWGVLIFSVHFRFERPAPMGEGILINFGDAETAGGGTEDLPMNDGAAPVLQTPVPRAAQREVSTQDHEDAPAVATRREEPRTEPAEQPQERPREADPRAMFPGRTPGSTATSEGRGTGAGNQGHLAGDPAGSHDGTGTGTSGISFDLRGRRPVGEVRPDYTGNERGRHIVRIRVTVNPTGSVVNAEYQAQGSTTNSRSFVDEALKAARQQKFTPSEGDNLQAGVITYVFHVG